MKTKFDVITCPKCGCEYLPAEVFIPSYFFGSPEKILRSPDGKIGVVKGTLPDPTEMFTCEKCNCTFSVKAKFTFKIDIDETKDFSEEYVSPRNNDRLSLGEE